MAIIDTSEGRTIKYPTHPRDIVNKTSAETIATAAAATVKSYSNITCDVGDATVSAAASNSTLALTSSDGSVVVDGTDATKTVDLRVEESNCDHGSLGGLGDDDHTQYLDETRHDADDHSSLNVDHTKINDFHTAVESSKLDDFTAPDDNTDLDASTTTHGLAPKAVAPAATNMKYLGLGVLDLGWKNKDMFDATAPVTQAFSDVASAGSALVPARRDHKHGMMADPSSNLIAKSILTEQGDVIYASAASTPAALAHGTSGQYLMTGGHGANPSWATVGASATENTVLGDTAGGSAGDYNTCYGYGAGSSIANGGDYNVGIGAKSLKSTNTGTHNIALGYYSLYSNTSGGGNIALGDAALASNTTASGDLAIGTSALAQKTSGVNNTAVGHYSLDADTTGGDNVAVGYDSLGACTEGLYNTAVGTYALAGLTTGDSNVAIGENSLHDNTTSDENVAVGNEALHQATGHNNVGVGAKAGYDGTLLTTGSHCTLIGNKAQPGSGTADYQTVIGAEAVGDGASSVTLGRDSDTVYCKNAVSIGHAHNHDLLTFNNERPWKFTSSGSGATTILSLQSTVASKIFSILNSAGSVQMQWGNATNDYVWSPPIYSASFASGRDVYVQSDGLLGYISSSLKYKQNITNMEDTSWIHRLRPVNFIYKSDTSQQKKYGLIAEEVNAVNSAFVSYDKDGAPETIDYKALIVPLLAEVQKLRKEVDALKQK